MRLHERFRVLLPLTLIVLFSACGNDDDAGAPSAEVPASYAFERNGLSTVDFSGQTDRLNMLAEIKTYIASANNGDKISGERIMDMFQNLNAPFDDEALNSSTRKLEDKTLISEVGVLKDMFAKVAEVSTDVADNGTLAAQGIPGKLPRGSGYILVNEKGWEFSQFVEKGLMGSCFYHQIYNVYLTDGRVGDGVDNTNVVEGTNYTAMEHHWDEAFGYFGVPLDFPQGDVVLEDDEDRFWAEYTHKANPFLGTNKLLMDAYLTGRTAIVNKDYQVRDAQRAVLYAGHELVAAASALHYINEAISDFNNGDTGNAFHHLSEGYPFVKALQYSPYKRISQAQVEKILSEDLGTDGDFWTVTIAGLNQAKNTLVLVYEELEPVKDQL
ncbi:MAG: DUF4856 domain-containing protein [Imperialibacter sp.]|uniref:DUF4856 domain-containing protein n=1 Tax=Imperialibacter sp. TaxID=2038411 RepID=UPI003A85F298